MKKRKINKKLSLNKSTVSSLNGQQLVNAKGGDFPTGLICETADGTACPEYCGPFIETMGCGGTYDQTCGCLTVYLTCNNLTFCI